MVIQVLIQFICSILTLNNSVIPQLHKSLCFNINILSILPVWPTVCHYPVELSLLSFARVSCYKFLILLKLVNLYVLINPQCFNL